jgi:hypothetical protein
MTKKNFKGGLSSLLGEAPEEKKTEVTTAGAKRFLKDLIEATEDPETPKRGRPKSNFKEITKSSQEGTKENETRATFIINEELLDKLKAIAYWDRVLIKEVVNTALQEAVSKYEKKHGEVKTLPNK